MTEEVMEVDDGMDAFDRMMGQEHLPDDSEVRLETTQKLRFALVRKHIGETSNEKMFAQVNTTLNNIDKQELVKLRMAQDKEEGAANREVAGHLFAKMIKEDVAPTKVVEQPKIEESGIPLLEDELLQGDDTTNSVII